MEHAGELCHLCALEPDALEFKQEKKENAMKNEYPPRLSVAELREEFTAYLEHRAGQVEQATVIADRTHIGQYLDWLETGLTRMDRAERLMREYTLVDEI